MRSKITVQQLPPPLADEDLQQATAYLHAEIRKLARLNPKWLVFCREKIALANETLSFLLKQRLRLHHQGYPSSTQDYLRLIEQQMDSLKAVYSAFFQLSPALIYEIPQQAPDVFVWLMFEPEFGDISPHLLLAFNQLEQLSPDMAKIIILHSSVAQLDVFLATITNSFPRWSAQAVTYMAWRHSLSIGLAKHWLQQRQLEPNIIHPILAMLSVQQSGLWLQQNSAEQDHLFERLVNHQHSNNWFRQYLADTPLSAQSKQASTFAKLLEWHQFMHFDPRAEQAPIELALTSKMDWVEVAVEQLAGCDEQQGEQWLYAFYIIYGDKFPLNPSHLGIDYQWPQAVTIVEQWVENDHHRLTSATRLGEKLTYASTLNALKDPIIPAPFRQWMWRQLCVHAHLFIFWDPLMPRLQQQQIITKLKSLRFASERFDLRNAYEIMGN